MMSISIVWIEFDMTKKGLFLIALTVAFATHSIDASEIYVESRCAVDSPSECVSGAGVEFSGNRTYKEHQYNLAIIGSVDEDSSRTFFDIKKFNYNVRHGLVDFLVGVNVLHWGVTETRNLVDVVNQRNYATDYRGFDKLGQPMFMIGAKLAELGRLELGYMPYFREVRIAESRAYPGFPIAITESLIDGESQQRTDDFFLRWEGSVENLDIGLAYIDIVQRIPNLNFQLTFVSQSDIDLRLIADHERQDGFLLDLQYLIGEWGLKFEGVDGNSQDVGDFFQYAVGAEYALYDVGVDSLDIRLSLEYYNDSRENGASLLFLEDDISLTMIGQYYSDKDVSFTLNYLEGLESGVTRFYSEFSIEILSGIELMLTASYLEAPSDTIFSTIDTGFGDVSTISNVFENFIFNESFIQTRLRYFF